MHDTLQVYLGRSPGIFFFLYLSSIKKIPIIWAKLVWSNFALLYPYFLCPLPIASWASQLQLILMLPMSQFLQLLSSPFSGSMSCCRNTSTGKVEGTSSQWLCWTFLLPYVLLFEGGVREEVYPWNEQEKLLALLFHFSGCCHIVVLAANWNCHLKPWGKLFYCCLWHMYVSKAGTSVCCWG